MIEKEYFGFINIDKNEEWTSHDVVAKLRSIFKFKKIGHAGTLDPFATGVLPVALGSATRLIRFLDKDKAYLAELDLSFTTDTDDLTGEKLKETKNKISQKELSEKLNSMLGDFEQYPPLYSAKKINGKKLYELMREGKELDLSDIKPKQVYIESINILDFNYPYAKIEVFCKEGTYIRSIARDVGAHLTSLRRTRSNAFDLASAVTLEDLQDEDLNPEDFIIDVRKVLNIPGLSFSRKEVISLQQGQKVYCDDASFVDQQIIQCIDEEDELVGLAQVMLKPEGLELQPKIIFA